jgi:YHS domain-containing protein
MLKLSTTLATAVLALSLGSINASAQDTKPEQSTAVQANEEPIRTIKEWNISKKKLAASGYDVVAYFPEGGAKPTKGKKKITTTYKGVVYRFASKENLELFLAEPAQYEPAFGGWCAWAMTTGSKTEINPKTFIIRDGRLFLFYNGLFGNTKTDWENGNQESLEQSANAEWETISNEKPVKPKITPSKQKP